MYSLRLLTSAKNRVDGLPVLRVLDLRRIGFGGVRELTRSTAMYRRVSATSKVERQGLGTARGHLLATSGWKFDPMAGKVGAGGVEWRFDTVALDGDGEGDVEVSIGSQREAGCEEEACCHGACVASRGCEESNCLVENGVGVGVCVGG